MEDFSDDDLDRVKISNLLDEQNETKEKGQIIKENDNINKESLISNSKKFKTKKTENFCDSYFFVFIDFLIQSLISLCFYYLCYIFAFDSEGIILTIYLIIALLIFIALICYIAREDFNLRYYKFSNYFLFIIINIFKIIFDVFFYLLIVSDKGKDGIGYSKFKARAFWKSSICLFYLFLVFYNYFKKYKKSLCIPLYLISSCFCLIMCLFMLIFSQTNDDNMFRVINYAGYTFLELFFVIYAIYFENKEPEIFDCLKIKINWRVNRIDFLRFGIIIFASISRLIIFSTNKCRCCKRTK